MAWSSESNEPHPRQSRFISVGQAETTVLNQFIGQITVSTCHVKTRWLLSRYTLFSCICDH
jgi:hypothetical protein